MLIRAGTPAEIRAATLRVLEKLAPLGGLIVQDGNNVPPDSPLDNINAMMEAAEQWGRP
jgi:uroporphyrinogen-III decarboxylase